VKVVALLRVVQEFSDEQRTQINNMSDRQNTLVCGFDMRSPRITAFQIHECIYEKMQLTENDISMIQIDGPKRHVFIKSAKTERMQHILQETNGQMEFRHDNGELSMVKIEPAGMGVRRIRIANLPPEVHDRIIREMFTKYGEVKDITEDAWSRIYRYKVSNGICIATVNFKQHIPSHMTIANNRVLITYEGQTPTCYGCNGTRHQYQECPRRKQMKLHQTKPSTSSWADIVLQGTTSTRTDKEQEVNTAPQDSCSDGYEKDLHPLPSREECQKSPEIAATLDTQMTATAEDTMNAEQEVHQSEGMTVDEYGPFDNTEDTR
jgi:hypothetical protein